MKEQYTRYIFTINKDLLKILKMIALDKNISVSLWVTRAIMEKMAKDKE